MCGDKDNLLNALRLLNGEVTPRLLLRTDPPTEGGLWARSVFDRSASDVEYFVKLRTRIPSRNSGDFLA